MSPVCAFCGEHFPRDRLACPHCGSDWETGWKEEETREGLDLPEPDRTEAIYRRYATADEGMLRDGAVKLAALHEMDRQRAQTVIPW